MATPVEQLMHANLTEVFGERGSAARAEAAARTYAADVVFSDPDEVVVGVDAVVEKAGRILDGAPGFVFRPAGPVHENHDLGYLAWEFGPADAEPVVTGFDVCFIEAGRITKVYTVLTAS